MIAFDQDNRAAQRLDSLRPGWRGRLRLLAPEEARTSAPESIIGTIVDAMKIDRGPGSEDASDPFVTICANYRRGRFVSPEGEPRFTLRVSQIIAIEPM